MTDIWAPPEYIALIVRTTNRTLDDAIADAESMLSMLRDARAGTDELLDSTITVDEAQNMETAIDRVQSVGNAISRTLEYVRALD